MLSYPSPFLVSHSFLYLPSRPSIAIAKMDRQFLPRGINDQITTHHRTPTMPPDTYNSRKWIILKKESEHPVPMLPREVAQGQGIPFTAGRYLCRLAGDGNENKLAFMRIYKQIPQTGTEFESLRVRKAQAANAVDPDELLALRELTDGGCTATPRLLGWRVAKQGEDDLVPKGYIVYLVWEKVQGEPLSERKFWCLPYDKRELIRQNFKKAYSFVTEISRYYILRANLN